MTIGTDVQAILKILLQKFEVFNVGITDRRDL
jgi:hypothetical protein